MDINRIVDRYVSVWNEPDTDKRRLEIVSLWAPDGLHYAKSHTCHGYAALEGTFLGGCIFSGRAAGRVAAGAVA